MLHIFLKIQSTHKFVLISRIGRIHHIPCRLRRPRLDAPPDAWLGQGGGNVSQLSFSFSLMLQQNPSTGVIVWETSVKFTHLSIR